MCVDYTDLNMDCLQDPFSLPRIHQTVDSTFGYDLLSFLDCYTKFHQIMLKRGPNQDFVLTPFRVYCYTTMPFGMKNMGN